MTRRNVRKQEWVFPLFSPDSDDGLSLNFHRFVILYKSCDTQSVGLQTVLFTESVNLEPEKKNNNNKIRIKQEVTQRSIPVSNIIYNLPIFLQQKFISRELRPQRLRSRHRQPTYLCSQLQRRQPPYFLHLMQWWLLHSAAR